MVFLLKMFVLFSSKNVLNFLNQETKKSDHIYIYSSCFVKENIKIREMYD